MSKDSSSTWWKYVSIFLVGISLGVAGSVQVVPHPTQAGDVQAKGGDFGTEQGFPSSSKENTRLSKSQGALHRQGDAPVDIGNLHCAAGQNGGATDTGVTANSIKLATTVVRTGQGAAFLGDVQPAMEAVVHRVNRLGGICGRLLDVKYVDDGWKADSGQRYIQDFIKSGYFAIPVGPSSEGLNAAVRAGDIDAAGIPVVGTDGMLISQYQDPWVWPVAVSTASSARIMVDDAYSKGARSFAIVFDKNYKFGSEAAEAFNNEVKRIMHNTGVPGYSRTHGCSQSFCGVQSGAASYSTEGQTFQRADLVAMFLEPATALTWMSANSEKTGLKFTFGGQPLFTRDFAVNCQSACDGMVVWTGYKPPIENYQNDENVRTYESDMRKASPTVDVTNAFAEGGFVGMELLVQALTKVGPYLTRVRLRAVLDSMDLRTGLTVQPTLSWRPGSHFAAASMQGFAIQYKGNFSGWRTGDIVRDSTPQSGCGGPCYP